MKHPDQVRAENRDLVRNYFDEVFNRHQVADGARRALGETYIQHNPHEADGPEGFIAHFSEFVRRHPESGLEVIHVIAEGDFVAVLGRWSVDKSSPGVAVADFYRVENCRLVEHWDVIQELATDAVPAWSPTT